MHKELLQSDIFTRSCADCKKHRYTKTALKSGFDKVAPSAAAVTAAVKAAAAEVTAAITAAIAATVTVAITTEAAVAAAVEVKAVVVAVFREDSRGLYRQTSQQHFSLLVTDNAVDYSH